MACVDELDIREWQIRRLFHAPLIVQDHRAKWIVTKPREIFLFYILAMGSEDLQLSKPPYEKLLTDTASLIGHIYKIYVTSSHRNHSFRLEFVLKKLALGVLDGMCYVDP